MVELDGIEVFVEKTVTTSNVQDVLNTIQGKKLVEASSLVTLLLDHLLAAPRLAEDTLTHEQRHFYANKAKTEMRYSCLKGYKNAVHTCKAR